MIIKKNYNLEKQSVGGGQVLLTIWSKQGAIQGQLAVYSESNEVRILVDYNSELLKQAYSDIKTLLEKQA